MKIYLLSPLFIIACFCFCLLACWLAANNNKIIINERRNENENSIQQQQQQLAS